MSNINNINNLQKKYDQINTDISEYNTLYKSYLTEINNKCSNISQNNNCTTLKGNLISKNSEIALDIQKAQIIATNLKTQYKTNINTYDKQNTSIISQNTNLNDEDARLNKLIDQINTLDFKNINKKRIKTNTRNLVIILSVFSLLMFIISIILFKQNALIIGFVIIFLFFLILNIYNVLYI